MNDNTNINSEAKVTMDEIEAMLKADPSVQKALETVAKDDAISKDFINETLNRINVLMKDKNTEFNINHGFQALGKCINFLGQLLYPSLEAFQNDLVLSHKIVVENVMESLPDEDLNNFSLKRLMMVSGSLIDYVYWRKALGECILPEEAQELRDKLVENKVIPVDFTLGNK